MGESERRNQRRSTELPRAPGGLRRPSKTAGCHRGGKRVGVPLDGQRINLRGAMNRREKRRGGAFGVNLRRKNKGD